MNKNYFAVADLKSRYDIGKQADINRRKHLKIESQKIDGTYVITKTELDLLDELDQFLKSKTNAKMEDFQPSVIKDVSSNEITTMNASLELESESNLVKTPPDFNQQPIQLSIPGLENLKEFVVQECLPKLTTLVEKIASSQKNEVNELRQLQEIVEQGWWITTEQVENLIGTTPKIKKGKTEWQRGCFIFTKVGKIGNQNAWKVSRINN